MTEIVKAIMGAADEAAKRGLAANTVLLNGDLALVKRFYIDLCGREVETKPMIAGLEAQMAYNFPYDTAFLVMNKNARPTNADYLRAMSDEELANALVRETYGLGEIFKYGGKRTYFSCSDGEFFLVRERAVEHELDWLKQPGEEAGR